MRVCYDVKDPLYLGLKRRLENEGETFVTRSEADICLTDNLAGSEIRKAFGVGIILPEVCFKSLEYDVLERDEVHDVRYIISRWFDTDFSEQMLISLPIYGKFNDNLGDEVVSGIGARYIKEDFFSSYFENNELIKFLTQIKHRGFVSLEFVGRQIVSVHLGIPHFGIYNAFQGVYIDLAIWLSNPQPLLESWSLSLLVSNEHSVEGTRVPTNELLERRVWWLTESHKKDFVHTRNSQVAVVSGWGSQPRAAQQRVLDICRRLQVPGKLYRTDVASQVEKRFEEVVALLEAHHTICK